ncbi:hypothetical protein TU87_22495 [Pseudomonas weihenstephanensis]|nr:hypothetical protein TU87_22495 [Pseudomonas weihenstephanensis]
MRWSTTAAALLFAVLALVVFKKEPSQQDSEIGLSVSILNYTDQPLGVVYVNDNWAGGMLIHGGGNSFAGSASLPRKWRPGLTVRVDWQDDTLYQKDRNALHSAVVPVSPYTGNYPSILFVAFFPNQEIKVFPSSMGPGHPEFPEGLQRPETLCKANPICKEKFFD